MLKTENGALMTIMQGGKPLKVGDKVLLLYGSRSRIVPDQETLQGKAVSARTGT